VPPSGALDVRALALANRLVGNNEDAAALEVLVGGLAFLPSASVRVAVTGAFVPVSVGGRQVPWGTGLPVTGADQVEIGAVVRGLRAYVAVAGGIIVDRVLGSRSTDTLTGLGPPPVRPGDRLTVGVPTGRQPVAAEAVMADAAQPDVVRVRWGPRERWFERDGRALVEQEFTVDTESDRVALRLDGGTVRRLDERELPSEGIVTGAVQVPGDGRPLVFLNDHPVTGGYPVVAVVEPAERSRLSQVRPGDRLRFRAG
jgi:biotin-dependent carboxylase-like uncharacterized protein